MTRVPLNLDQICFSILFSKFILLSDSCFALVLLLSFLSLVLLLSSLFF